MIAFRRRALPILVVHRHAGSATHIDDVIEKIERLTPKAVHGMLKIRTPNIAPLCRSSEVVSYLSQTTFDLGEEYLFDLF